MLALACRRALFGQATPIGKGLARRSSHKCHPRSSFPPVLGLGTDTYQSRRDDHDILDGDAGAGDFDHCAAPLTSAKLRTFFERTRWHDSGPDDAHFGNVVECE